MKACSFFFLHLEGKVDSKQSFEDGWGATQSCRDTGVVCRHPHPDLADARPPRPRGRGKKMGQLSEEPRIEVEFALLVFGPPERNEGEEGET